MSEALPEADEVRAVACGIATAVAPESGITDVQASLLHSVTLGVTGESVDYRDLERLDAEGLAQVLRDRDDGYRLRIVHHMVLGELVLSPLPADVADRVTATAAVLGVDDDFVALARRYAEGALGLAWCDLRRNGFTEHWDENTTDPLHTKAQYADPFDAGMAEPELAEKWRAFAHLQSGTLGRGVWEMYTTRGFEPPGTPRGAAPYLAQHDFVHVLADYGTNIEGEVETFSLIGRADPDPKGFAWLATVIGLFETGYVHQQGALEMDLTTRNRLQQPGMTVRLADAIRRGKAAAEGHGIDLLAIDYHEIADQPINDLRAELHIVPKSPEALGAGSPSLFEPAGMSPVQRKALRRVVNRGTIVQ
jgi:hypothetical protein